MYRTRKIVMLASVALLLITGFAASQGTDPERAVANFIRTNEKAVTQDSRSPILVKKAEIVEAKAIAPESFSRYTLRQKVQFLPALTTFMRSYLPFEKTYMDEVAYCLSSYMKYIEMIYKDVNRLGDYNAYNLDRVEFMRNYRNFIDASCSLIAGSGGYSAENRILLGETVMSMIPTIREDLTPEWKSRLQALMHSARASESMKEIQAIETSILIMLQTL